MAPRAVISRDILVHGIIPAIVNFAISVFRYRFRYEPAYQ